MRASEWRRVLCVLCCSLFVSCDSEPSNEAHDVDEMDAGDVASEEEDSATSGVDPEELDAESRAEADGSAGQEMDAKSAGDAALSASSMVGAAGGSVVTNDGKSRVDIPEGALGNMMRITIAAAASAPSGALGPALEIGPSGMKFEKAVALSLSLPPEIATLDASSVTIGTVVQGRWQPAPVVFIDTESGRVHALIDHFSIWAIIPRPTEPCVVDVACSQKCCTGLHSGNELSTRCDHGGVLKYDDCYAACVGSAKVRNYSSPGLRDCCEKNRGQISDSGACVLRSQGAVDATLLCSRGKFSADEPVTVCFDLGGPTSTFGWCQKCRESCTVSSCVSRNPETGVTTQGRCVAQGNGCTACATHCAAREECGNDLDDDCNGAIDDGCAALACKRSAQCPAGHECTSGYCVACNTACTVAGCTANPNSDNPNPQPGQCVTFGNGCRACGSCEQSERCGNDRDDNCDGLVDEGCAAKACTSAAVCAPGFRCQEGYCEACGPSCNAVSCAAPSADRSPGQCLASGNGCTSCGACGTSEICGNQEDDDCDGLVDDGCAALLCSRSAHCAPGSQCNNGYCTPCGAGNSSCALGASCTYQNSETGSQQGSCAEHGNNCGACEGGCDASETCGNAQDDNCNGQIDEGCAARRCVSGVTCPVGEYCVLPSQF